ncbi:MAG: diguanylate cyclase [Synechocystis sp.]|nr:diguanylate cyclase [Synechocystis sp.]
MEKSNESVNPTGQTSILIVEDELLVARQLSKKLSQLGYKINGIASSGQAALMAVFQTPPDLVLMDIVIKGEIDGIETARRIHETAKIPIIFLTAYCNEELINRATLSGSYGYMIKPVKAPELSAMIKMTLNKHRQYMSLYSQVPQDSLTGITRQHHIQERMAIEEARANRNRQNIGIIVLSIDQLALIQKTYGHEAENLVFNQLLIHLNNILRQTDFVYRNEDNQIFILLTDCSLENAKNIAEKIRADSHDLMVKYDDRQIWMSFSLGVDCYCAMAGIPLEDVMAAAIANLTQAQQDGGNRVVLSKSLTP